MVTKVTVAYARPDITRPMSAYIIIYRAFLAFSSSHEAKIIWIPAHVSAITVDTPVSMTKYAMIFAIVVPGSTSTVGRTCVGAMTSTAKDWREKNTERKSAKSIRIILGEKKGDNLNQRPREKCD